MKIEQAALLGRDEAHLSEFLDCRVNSAILSPLHQLALDAKDAGFCLGVVSAYRSFERQLLIWNSKAQGLRPILDGSGAPLEIAELSDDEALFAILRWSALPGTSRHHWGTDLDVVDLSVVAQGYQVQLTEQETCTGGIFARFHQWLDYYLATSKSGFFRPYALDLGGIACEPWHLSYGPVARQYQALLSKDVLLESIEATDIRLKSSIVRHFDEIYSRFVWVDWGLYPN